jgi:hypothetical protein
MSLGENPKDQEQEERDDGTANAGQIGLPQPPALHERRTDEVMQRPGTAIML